ncbi:hypothetical protein RhiirA4_474888 [Rhizophagus irregularis]|uniref:Uncharacterized protein n=1 Tax=Rhizophagus irregularis TaxID=588596 RepID=A0A2I1H984_9GLOM|nr:hypothetical protein RhiirA4_474888 [Rhizophagus irregularis]
MPPSKRGRKKNGTTTNVQSSSFKDVLKDMAKVSSVSIPLQSKKTRNTERGEQTLTRTKKQKDTSVIVQPSIPVANKKIDYQDVPLDLPSPRIQISVDDDNRLENTNNRKKKDVHEKENENTINDEQLDNSTEFDATPVQQSSRVAEKQSTKSSQTFPKIVKPKNKSISIEDILASSKSTNVSSESISNVAITEAVTRRKTSEKFIDPPIKHLKFNTNIHSVLNKLLEEQLEQRTTINAIKENYGEIKREVLENRMILQNILTILTTGPLTMTSDQMQGDKPKQRLKRKDTKFMWWDAPMTKACHQLFQENKNPSDSKIEEAFKSQIQKDCPKKMQELINSNGCENLWNAAYSITLEYFRNHRAAYIRKIKDATYMFLNLFSCKLNKFATPEEVRSILQRTFNNEELQNENNIIFGITVTIMFLDPTYDQAEISSSKVQERMNKWESLAIIQKWLKCEENLFEDNVMNHDNTEKNDDMQFDNVLMEESDIENESISIYNEDKRINNLNGTINMENTDSEDSSN